MSGTKIMLSIALFSLLYGCATVNEGENDIGYVAINASKSDDGQQKTEKHNEDNEEQSPKPEGAAEGSKIHSIYYGTKNDARFLPSDRVSMHLITAFVGKFDEGWLIPSELRHLAGQALTSDRPRVKGEVAIFARTFEFTGQGKGDLDQEGKAGRVIFYSDDVYRRQNLNQRNTPFFGPIKVPSGSLVLRLDGLELDTTSEQEKALLSTLAGLGGKAYPPASTALDALNTIGSSFIDSQPKSTTFMRTTVTFDASRGGNVNHLMLRPGYYIFLRDSTREGRHCWDQLEFKPAKGLLFWKRTATSADCPRRSVKPGKPYRSDSYIVIEIAKNIGTGTLDIEQRGLEALYNLVDDDPSTAAQSISDQKVSLEADIIRERILQEIQSQISIASSEAEPETTRISAGREAITDLFEQAEFVCSDEAEKTSEKRVFLRQEQLNMLFRSVRQSNAYMPDAVRERFLSPDRNNKDGYCLENAMREGFIAQNASKSRLDSVDAVKQVFGISEPEGP